MSARMALSRRARCTSAASSECQSALEKMSGTRSTSQRFPGEVGSAKISCAMPISRTRRLRRSARCACSAEGSSASAARKACASAGGPHRRIDQFVIAAVAQARIGQRAVPGRASRVSRASRFMVSWGDAPRIVHRRPAGGSVVGAEDSASRCAVPAAQASGSDEFNPAVTAGRARAESGRRSSVNGYSGLIFGGSSTRAPGVWPMRSKRASRRPSAS